MYIKDRIKTKHMIVYDSKTSPQKDIGAAEIDRRDRDRGCVMIGAHYVIRRSGMIETGRELDKLGNCKRRYNKDSVYVLLIGKDGDFTQEQLQSLATIRGEIQELYPEAVALDFT